jgi:hypothetical protein
MVVKESSFFKVPFLSGFFAGLGLRKMIEGEKGENPLKLSYYQSSQGDQLSLHRLSNFL